MSACSVAFDHLARRRIPGCTVLRTRATARLSRRPHSVWRGVAATVRAVSVSTAPGARRASALAHLSRFRALRLDGAGGAALLALGFILLTALWLALDARVPDWDSGDHLQHSIYYYAQIDSGHLSDLLKTDNPYPPVVELVGTLEAFIGVHPLASIDLTPNTVVIPLVALRCFET